MIDKCRQLRLGIRDLQLLQHESVKPLFDVGEVVRAQWSFAEIKRKQKLASSEPRKAIEDIEHGLRQRHHERFGAGLGLLHSRRWNRPFLAVEVEFRP